MATRGASGGGRGAVEGTTRVVGIFGDPVEHSLSPRMHNAAFAARGIDCVYVPFRPSREGIAEAIAAIRALRLVGVNVTVPFKRDVVPYLDRVSATARAVGAVNTVVRRGSRLFGENTDSPGFAAALAAWKVRVRGAPALMIGAGGAARAAVHALLAAGAEEIVIANRTRRRATELAAAFGRKRRRLRVASLDALVDRGLLASRRLVVNSTSIGLEGGGFLRYDCAATPRGCVHFDLAYRRGATPFLALARKARRPVIDGRYMLLYQGALAFELFTGEKAPLSAMARAIGIRARGGA